MGFSLRNLSRNIRDVFDANTEEDQKRRMAQGRPRVVNSFSVRNNSLTRGASRYIDQVNPLDSGRTWKQRTPTSNISGLEQARNRMLNSTKFTSSFNERLLGGNVRSAIRTGEWLLPGDQKAAANRLIDTYAPEAGSPAAQNLLTKNADKNSWGGKIGTGAKFVGDVGMMVAPTGAVDKFMKGTKAVNYLSKGGTAAKGLGYVARVAPGSLVGTGIDALQEIGRGNDVNLAKSGGVGLAIDLGLPVVGKGLKRIAGKAPVGQAIDAVGNLVDDVKVPTTKPIMDTTKLDFLNEVKAAFKDGYPSTKERNRINQGLQQLKNEDGLDFITGAPADRRARLNDFLEQNGQTISEMQDPYKLIQDTEAKIQQLDDVANLSDKQARRVERMVKQAKSGSQPDSTTESFARLADGSFADPKLEAKLQKVFPKLDQKGGGQIPFIGKAAPEAPTPGTKPKVALKQSPVDSSPNSTMSPVEVNKALSQAAETAKDKYGKPSIARRAEAVANPTAALTRIDQTLEKAMGLKPGTLPKSQSLEHLADVSINMRSATGKRVAHQKLKDFGIDKVIQKYGEGTKQGIEFRNYQNAKHAIEIAQKRRLSVLSDETGKKLNIDDLRKFVDDYEARNPIAIEENARFKAWADSEIDAAIKDGRIEPEVGEYVKKFYTNYVPIERVLPENLARPSIDMAPIGAMGKTKVIQELQGSSIPASTSFDPFFKRAAGFESEKAKQNLFTAFKDAVESGNAPKGTRIVQSAEQVARARQLKTMFKELGDIQKSLKIEKAKTKARGRVVNVKTTQAEKNLTTKMRKVLSDSVKDPDAKAAINGLTTDDLLEISDNMINTNQGGTWRVTKSYTKNLNAQKEIEDTLQAIQGDISTLTSARKDIGQKMLEVQTDPTTGKQIVSGLDKGLPVKIEVTPEIAKILQGMDQAQLSGVAKVFKGVSKPFRSAYTGLLNPMFSAISFAFFDAPMGFINSPNGWRTLVSPAAIGEMFKSIDSSSTFQKQLAAGGAQLPTGSYVASGLEGSAKAIADQKNLFTKLVRTLDPRNLSETIEKLDILGGKLQGATRTRISKVAYDDAIRKGLPENDAIANAVYAYNNTMPNFARASRALRELDSVLPYTSASVSGTRSFGQAVRRRPIATTAKAATVLAPAVAIVGYNLQTDEGQSFYEDMKKSGKEYVLDSNFVVVLPGASKNPETGEWEGVVKIPLAPELRAINKVVWKQSYEHMSGQEQVGVKDYARAVFDTATGSTITPTAEFAMGKGGIGGNPALNVATGLMTNVNPKTGQDIVYEDMRDLPESEQKTENTSKVATSIANALGVSPMKVQFVMNEFGLAGRLASGSSPVEEVKGRFVGAYGKSEGRMFYDDLKDVSTTIKSPRDKQRFLSHYKKDETPGLLDSASKATDYLNSPEIYNASKELDRRSRENGKPGNPLFDLTDEQRKKVLIYRQNKMLNNGKQNYDKNGQPLFTALGLDEPWYDELRDDETAFYKAIGKGDGGDEKTFSGGARPKASPELEKVQEAYFAADKETRKGILAAHPELLELWEASDGFANRERTAIGLKPISEDEYTKYGSGSGYGSGGGGSRKAKSAGSAYKYAVSLNAGGKFKAPTVKKRAINIAAAKQQSTQKPKVTLKKSLV